MVEEIICLQCGDRGYVNAFVHCIRCLKFAVHRYCLDVIPETLDEFVSWLCDDCKVKVQKPSSDNEHKVLESNTKKKQSGLVQVQVNEQLCKNASERVCDDRANSVEGGGESPTRHIPIELDRKDDRNDSISVERSSSYHLQEKRLEGNPIGSTELPAGCLKRKKMRKRKKVKRRRRRREEWKDINESTRLASDLKLPSNVNEKGGSEQKDREEKKRKVNITESTFEEDQRVLATISYDECAKANINESTRLASDSKLPPNVNGKGSSEQKDRDKKKRKLNDAESTIEEDQQGLATTSYDERVKENINESTRLASDLKLPSNVNEKGCSEQKDQEKEEVKKKKKIDIMESTADKERHTLAAAAHKECAEVDIDKCKNSASDLKLFSEVPEKGCSEPKGQEKKEVKVKNMKPISEKDRCRLTTTSCNEGLDVDTNECSKLASDSIVPSEVTGNCCSKKKDQGKKKFKITIKNKRQRHNMESTNEQDQLATLSCNEGVKVDTNECPRSVCDSILPSKLTENSCSEKKDQEKKKFKIKISTKGRSILESGTDKDQHGLVNGSVKVGTDECTRPTNDLALCTKVTENCCSQQKEQEQKMIENEKSRKRNTMESTSEIDHHKLTTESFDELVKVDFNESMRLVIDSTLPSKVTENGCSEQKDQDEKMIKNKNTRKENAIKSTFENSQDRADDEHAEEGLSKCRRSASDSKLPSQVIENGCSEQKGQDEKMIKKTRKQSTMKSTSENGRDRVDDEYAEEGFSKCTRSASDSTLPSQVRENGCSEQKGLECIPNPINVIIDLGITVIPADNPVISSDGPPKSLQEKKTIASSETISQNQAHKGGVSQSLLTNNRLQLENESTDSHTGEKDLGSSNAPIEIGEEAQTSTSDQIRNICQHYPEDLDFSAAEPIAMPIWRGCFNIRNDRYGRIEELLAHISNKACYKVYETASQFEPVLCLEMLPKSDIWPNSFRRVEPDANSIALYFFPSNISEQVFEHLVEEMMQKELGLRALLQNAELLIFTSIELPLRYWRFRDKFYLWGVFRGKKARKSMSSPHSSVQEVAENALIRKRCDHRSPISPLSNSVH